MYKNFVVHKRSMFLGRLATDESRRYMSMMSQIEERGNILKSYLIDKAYTVEVLAVTERFRRRGIGQMLLEVRF